MNYNLPIPYYFAINNVLNIAKWKVFWDSAKAEVVCNKNKTPFFKKAAAIWQLQSNIVLRKNGK